MSERVSTAETGGPPDTCDVRCIHPEAVAAAQRAMPGGDVVAGSAEMFRLLGDPGRLRLLLALRSGELCVCDLAAVTGASESSVSHSLRLLRASRAVRARREGRNMYYALHDGHVEQLLDMMTAHMGEPE
ncbi:regulatory protein ArsR (plasmid) [Deinococcus proteolyticus MRP]|uniref:Regulatory protein ArsR n=1 Tax=Deinococcus proteolyticus (strain ATCC 35074 / DSM 20540 / JCM 6276 / NBRC 101906 / NCIMB 13154 / VKM Ac-1939 / CCM 2703 / MRP) TaxID=693977 RepID=F0RPI3_DEIPM|nr:MULTISPECIES: metalloregulator ArsR/SmtB family transcription factor [Deinococcus]ADY27289.1 regulatory protein ArsR [Deinococcus proteolyticus MRP]MCY1704158.1 metalloregulator ArsR/SmtB family transcription factor [Deinococcus sp. SL84]